MRLCSSSCAECIGPGPPSSGRSRAACSTARRACATPAGCRSRSTPRPPRIRATCSWPRSTSVPPWIARHSRRTARATSTPTETPATSWRPSTARAAPSPATRSAALATAGSSCGASFAATSSGPRARTCGSADTRTSAAMSPAWFGRWRRTSASRSTTHGSRRSSPMSTWRPRRNVPGRPRSRGWTTTCASPRITSPTGARAPGATPSHQRNSSPSRRKAPAGSWSTDTTSRRRWGGVAPATSPGLSRPRSPRLLVAPRPPSRCPWPASRPTPAKPVVPQRATRGAHRAPAPEAMAAPPEITVPVLAAAAFGAAGFLARHRNPGAAGLLWGAAVACVAVGAFRMGRDAVAPGEVVAGISALSRKARRARPQRPSLRVA